MDYQFEKPTHLVVCLPEIVNNILSFLVPACYHEDNKKKMYTHLFPCLFVNRLWNDCASRIIWRKAFFEDTKGDLETFLKFASVIAPNVFDHVATFDALGTISFDAMDITGAPMIKYPSRSSSISSVSTVDTIHTPTECSMISFSDEKMTINTNDFFDTNMNKGINYYQALESQTRLKTYTNALRCLSIRKIKEKYINEPLSRIGSNATRLEYLDVYICDYFTNETLYPFLIHQSLTYLSLAGCHHISDEAVLKVAEYCKGLEHLDLRACGLVSDVSLSAIAMNCPKLKHLNVGRIRDREKVTIKSISLIAKYTQASVLGLAGCDIDDNCMKVLAKYRNSSLERVSVNSCFRLTNETVYAYIEHCPNLSVFEMKECHHINDWEAVAELVQRRVLLTLCDHQNRACSDWARIHGRTLDVKAPLK